MLRKLNYLKSINVIVLLLSLVFSGSISAQCPEKKRSNYFDGKRIPSTSGRKKTITPKDNENITGALRKAMNQLGAKGGTININAGKKRTVIIDDLELKSKIRLQFSSNITIKPVKRDAGKNSQIFILGRGKQVKDVQITSQGGRFKIDFSDFAAKREDGANKLRRVRPFNVISAQNFYIGNFNVTSGFTVFSNVELNIKDGNSKNRKSGVDVPFRGIVENITSLGNHVGYGLVQIRAGKRIYFNNLDGKGGITLRVESDFIGGLSSSAATIDEVYGNNIVVRNGDAAVVLSPHRVNQGCVIVDKIQSINSTWAIQLAGGYVSRTGKAKNKGSFASTSALSITKWTPTTTKTSSQVKRKDLGFYACKMARDLDKRFSVNKQMNLDKESVPGKSIDRVRYFPNCDGGKSNKKFKCYTVKLDGANSSQQINAKRCKNVAKKSITENNFEIEEGVESTVVIPNPATDVVNINTKKFISASIYNSYGSKVIESSSSSRITLSNLPAGLYFVHIQSNLGTSVEKLIIQ